MLRTYCTFNIEFVLENYLQGYMPRHEKSLHLVEDEFHFLCECETYSALREDLFKSINEFCPGFEDMEPRQNFVYI